jgi:DNA-directed RNA polymerase subunit M/transcription elongation factor TFIIS
MQALPHVAQKVRIEWIQLLAELAKGKVSNPILYARCLENAAHGKRQSKKIIGEDVIVFRYGDEDVLDLDSFESHENASNSHYAQMMRRFAWCLQSKTTLKNPMDLVNANDDIFLAGTEHEETERKFFKRLDDAREVLLGKGDAPKKGIFSCPKCKSFDVDTEQKQTRSSDEPMTIFCTCNVCGQRFVR